MVKDTGNWTWSFIGNEYDKSYLYQDVFFYFDIQEIFPFCHLYIEKFKFLS